MVELHHRRGPRGSAGGSQRPRRRSRRRGRLRNPRSEPEPVPFQEPQAWSPNPSPPPNRSPRSSPHLSSLRSSTGAAGRPRPQLTGRRPRRPAETPPPVDDSGSRRFDAQVRAEMRSVRNRRSFPGSSCCAGSSPACRVERRDPAQSWSSRSRTAGHDGAPSRRSSRRGFRRAASDALELVATLKSELDKRWCLGILARRGDHLEGSQLNRALSLVSSPSACGEGSSWRHGTDRTQSSRLQHEKNWEAGFGVWACDRAPKARKTHSLGREPQEPGISTRTSPRKGATDCGCGVSRSHKFPFVCRRFAASRMLFPYHFLGLTPQANYLSPLRGYLDSHHDEGTRESCAYVMLRATSRSLSASRVWRVRTVALWTARPRALLDPTITTSRRPRVIAV